MQSFIKKMTGVEYISRMSLNRPFWQVSRGLNNHDRVQKKARPIEKLVKHTKRDRSVGRMLLIIFIQDEMSVTGAARRLNKARSCVSTVVSDGLRDECRPEGPQGRHEEDTEADKKDLPAGRQKGCRVS